MLLSSTSFFPLRVSSFFGFLSFSCFFPLRASSFFGFLSSCFVPLRFSSLFGVLFEFLSLRFLAELVPLA